MQVWMPYSAHVPLRSHLQLWTVWIEMKMPIVMMEIVMQREKMTGWTELEMTPKEKTLQRMRLEMIRLGLMTVLRKLGKRKEKVHSHQQRRGN